MKNKKHIIRYILMLIIILGFISAFVMCFWFVTLTPRYISILGGVVGIAWWVYRIINYKIDNK